MSSLLPSSSALRVVCMSAQSTVSRLMRRKEFNGLAKKSSGDPAANACTLSISKSSLQAWWCSKWHGAPGVRESPFDWAFSSQWPKKLRGWFLTYYFWLPIFDLHRCEKFQIKSDDSVPYLYLYKEYAHRITKSSKLNRQILWEKKKQFPCMRWQTV